MSGKVLLLCLLILASSFPARLSVLVSFCCMTHSPLLSGVKQAFFKIYGFHGGGIQTEHNGDGLSLSHS